MKKLWIFIPGILLIAAGCNPKTGTNPRAATNPAPRINGQVPTKTTPKNTSPTTTPTTGQALPKPSAQIAPASFTVSADDNGATLTNIHVIKGQQVKITFRINAKNVYHSGLDFRSSVVNTGAIPPGQSKTIGFTAGQSFDFTPYWPLSSIKKAYLVHVIVN